MSTIKDQALARHDALLEKRNAPAPEPEPAKVGRLTTGMLVANLAAQVQATHAAPMVLGGTPTPEDDPAYRSLVSSLTGRQATVTDAPAGYFKFTDYGNAERMASMAADCLRYVKEWNTWLWWDGRRWQRDVTGVATMVAKRVVRTLYVDAERLSKSAQCGDEKSAKLVQALGEWAKKCESASLLANMVKLAETELPIAARKEDFDTDPYAFNVSNGTIDLRTGELRAHRPADMITKLAPVSYDPTATCPIWDAFVLKILPVVNIRSWVRMFLGYSLVGLDLEQIVTFFYGTGSNGKSTMLGTIQNVVGEDYSFQAPPGLLVSDKHGTDESLARRQRGVVVGRRLIVVQEVELGRFLNESQVKALSGGDKVSSAALYEGEKQTVPSHTIVAAVNHKPRVRGRDHAIWRRLKLIPFTVTIPDADQDLHLKEKLALERVGILAWMVRGCLEWHKAGRLPDVKEINIATQDYSKAEDTIAPFLDEHTKCRKGELAPDGKLAYFAPIDELYRRYQSWCVNGGERVWSKRALSDALGEDGYPSEKRRLGGGPKETTGRAGLELLADPGRFALGLPVV